MFNALGDYKSNNEDEDDSEEGLTAAAAAETPQASVGGEMGGWAPQRQPLVTPGDEHVNDKVGVSRTAICDGWPEASADFTAARRLLAPEERVTAQTHESRAGRERA